MTEPLLLLIEDNPDDVALARRALAKGRVPATLAVARSGQEALSLLQTEYADRPPKAVFLDLNMPGLTGFELLRRLRAEEKTRHLPVVILTTSREPPDIRRGYDPGANSFVTKPVDFVEFSEVFANMTGYWINVNEAVN